MKEIHKKIIFEIIFGILCILNIITKMVHGYGIILVLLLLNGIYGLIFGWKKEKTSTTKEFILELITFILTFFILYYIFGLLIGFTPSGNYVSFEGIIQTILPIIFYSILREFFRYQLLKKEENTIFMYFTIFLLILLDLANQSYLIRGDTYSQVVYLVLSALPAITTNLSYSYLTRKENWKIISIYAIIISIYRYIFPVIPSATIFIETAINTILPILLWVRITSFYERDEEEEYSIKNILILLLPTILVTIMVYFYSGLFRYYAIAIATDSMSPTIQKGDIVIIDQKKESAESFQEGWVIAYRKDNHVIVHRIEKMRKEKGKFYFQTKGDKMKENDEEEVIEDNVIGVVSFKIRYLGYPTIWLNNL